MFKIGDFSKLTVISIRMLRYYDEIGLFKPISVDKFTNYRYYSAMQIPMLNTIVNLKELGFSSEEIRIVINQKDQTKNINFLKEKQIEFEEKLQTDKQRLINLSHYIENYNTEGNNMKYEVKVRKVESMKIVSLRKVIPNYTDEGKLWGEMMEKIHKHNIELSEGCFARFYDEKENGQGVDVEIAIQVPTLIDNVEGLVFSETEVIEKAATLLVAGDYVPNIQQGFNYMAKWLEDNNYKFAGAPRTDYITGPENEKNPENYLTEIIIPIK